MGGYGAFAGGFLEGINQGFIERRQRQEKMKMAAAQGGLNVLTGMMSDPSFAGDPETRADILKTYMTVLGDLQGGKSATRNAQGKKNDPIEHMQQQIGNILTTVYPSNRGQPAQPGAAPVMGRGQELGGIDASGLPSMSRQEVAPGMTGSPGTPDVKGPFKSQPRMQEELYQDESRKAFLREQQALDQIRLRDRLKQASDDAAVARKVTMFNQLKPLYGEAFARDVLGLKADPNKVQTVPNVLMPDGKTRATLLIKTDGTREYLPATTASEHNPTNAEEVRDIAKKAYAEKHGLKVEDMTTTQTVDAIKEYNARVKPPAAASIINVSNQSTDDELRSLAQFSLLPGGKDPAFGLGANNPQRDRYNKIKAQVISEKGATETAATKGEFTATQAALTDLTKTRTTMKAQENGTVAEIMRLKQLSAALPRSDIQAFNSLDQFLTAKLTPGTSLARYREALVGARSRYNQMISSMRGSGAATNMVRAETREEVVDKAMSNLTVQAAADEMLIGVRNVMKGMDDAINETRTNLSNVGKPKPAPTASEDPIATKLTKPSVRGSRASNEIIKQYSDAYGNKEAAIKALAAAGWN